MPISDIEERRSYMRQHAKERYDRRMAEIHSLLGGKCVVCGTDKNLEAHHVDPDSKEFNLSDGHSWPWDKVLEEVAKCELRCPVHHREVHLPSHGTLTRYRGHRCRCDACREAWNAKGREWKARHREKLRT